jgi:hypothetical protein
MKFGISLAMGKKREEIVHYDLQSLDIGIIIDYDICIYNTEDDLRSAIHHGLNNKNGDTYFQLNGLPVIRSSHGIYVKDGKKVVR